MAKMRMKAKALFMTVPFRLRPGRGVQEAETQVRRGSAAAMRSTSAYCCDMAGADRTGWWGYLPPLRQSRAGRQSDNRGDARGQFSEDDRSGNGARRRAWLGEPVGTRRTGRRRSEEHTSELQSLMRHSYAVFCLKKTKKA